MKKIISCILIFVILFFNLTSKNYAKNDYDIDMSSSFEEVYEDTYTDNDNHTIAIVIKEGNYNDKDKIYTKNTLDEVITLMYQYVTSYGHVAVIEKNITIFTENKYDCFEFVFEINSDHFGLFYQKYYIAVNKDDLFVLCIQTNEYEYFESHELEEIIDSLTIDDLIGRKQEFWLLWKRIFILGGVLIGIVIVIGVCNQSREKVLYEKAQELLHQQELAQKKAEREMQMNLGATNLTVKSEVNNPNFTAVNQNQVGGTKDNIKNKDFSTINNTQNNKEFSTANNIQNNKEFSTVANTKEKSLENNKEKIVEKIKCPNCGKEIEKFWAFCNECGHKLEKDEE